MRTALAFARLPPRDRRLVASASWELVRVALALRLRRRPARLVAQAASLPPSRPPREEPRRIAWAVMAASRRIPGTSGCLPRALACHRLLARSGIASDLRLAWRVPPGGDLEAHAWVEREGSVLLGALPDLGTYTSLHSGEIGA